MAVTLLNAGGVPIYAGLAADTKPTGVKPGARFLAYNTNAWYITYDGTNWVLEDGTGEVTASPTSNTVLDRLKALLTGIVLATGTAAIGKVGHDITGIADNRKTVTTAGTAVVLAASTVAKAVIITAETDNTGKIVVGGSTVVAALATRRGIPLDAGDSVVLQVDNLTDVYIDSEVNGDGVTFAYLT